MNYLLQSIFNFFYQLLERRQNHWNHKATEILAEKIKSRELKTTLKDVSPKIKKTALMDWPVAYRVKGQKIPKVTSHFGWRTLPNGRRNYHNGTDYKTLYSEGIACEDSIIKKIQRPDAKFPARFKYIAETKKWEKAAPKGRAWTPYIVIVGIHSGRKYEPVRELGLLYGFMLTWANFFTLLGTSICIYMFYI